MTSQVRLCIVLHNHQPNGNFDGVIAQAFQDSYLPFLSHFEPYDDLKIALHTSGPLMLWLAENQPEYLKRVASLVQAGRIEIVGGPFYEPILTMLPSRDRIGQINRYSDWLESEFNTPIAGMWMPERVWESQLIRDIVPAGIKYTLLDDYHFQAAGLAPDRLPNYFLTEDDGQVLRVFPICERLRYLMPFAPAEETIEYCRLVSETNPGAVLVFGDDGEKFGTWPNTKESVYGKGWLKQFFELLVANKDWLQTSTPSEVISESPPAGTVYLPECSYREMTEWALPVESQVAYESIVQELKNHPQWSTASSFVRGGNWRNFRVKYSEANEMYCRMLEVSRKLEFARRSNCDAVVLAEAEDHLYKSQCNCPYWHGAFGGIYLPHLRNATYRELIAADNLLDRIEEEDGEPRPLEWVDVTIDDFNKDLYPEVRLANDRLISYFAPSKGGMLYELDVRGAEHNLLASLQRRPEVYHQKILDGLTQHEGESAASIHDRLVLKQSDLDQRIRYDRYPRKSLVDHFYDEDISVEQVQSAQAMERGDFAELPYDAKLRRAPGKIQLQMKRAGNAWGIPLTLTKGITMFSGSQAVEITYLIEGIPQGKHFLFGVELNFAGMPSGADDRFYYDSRAQRLGHLGTVQDLSGTDYLGLIDQWLGLNVQITWNRPTLIWGFPVESVSQSEGGMELVHQSVCVQPHWLISGDEAGRWSVSMDVIATCEHNPTPRSPGYEHPLAFA